MTYLIYVHIYDDIYNKQASNLDLSIYDVWLGHKYKCHKYLQGAI
jgi:hypothetical protein